MKRKLGLIVLLVVLFALLVQGAAAEISDGTIHPSKEYTVIKGFLSGFKLSSINEAIKIEERNSEDKSIKVFIGSDRDTADIFYNGRVIDCAAGLGNQIMLELHKLMMCDFKLEDKYWIGIELTEKVAEGWLGLTQMYKFRVYSDIFTTSGDNDIPSPKKLEDFNEIPFLNVSLRKATSSLADFYISYKEIDIDCADNSAFSHLAVRKNQLKFCDSKIDNRWLGINVEDIEWEGAGKYTVTFYVYYPETVEKEKNKENVEITNIRATYLNDVGDTKEQVTLSWDTKVTQGVSIEKYKISVTNDNDTAAKGKFTATESPTNILVWREGKNTITITALDNANNELATGTTSYEKGKTTEPVPPTTTPPPSSTKFPTPATSVSEALARIDKVFVEGVFK